mmetsp:Transcript_939/g.2085  ORF Transcript_939/g.2085 Transcript_939/m.2085 type:complete len:261 (-) Transcript_939:2417-3199(-)
MHSLTMHSLTRLSIHPPIHVCMSASKYACPPFPHPSHIHTSITSSVFTRSSHTSHTSAVTSWHLSAMPPSACAAVGPSSPPDVTFSLFLVLLALVPPSPLPLPFSLPRVLLRLGGRGVTGRGSAELASHRTTTSTLRCRRLESFRCFLCLLSVLPPSPSTGGWPSSSMARLARRLRCRPSRRAAGCRANADAAPPVSLAQPELATSVVLSSTTHGGRAISGTSSLLYLLWRLTRLLQGSAGEDRWMGSGWLASRSTALRR